MNDRARPDPESPPADRLGRLAHDRPCLACGYDLVGQDIVRDPHYGLPMVTCPECGQAAALTEYPSLGVWGRRWGRLLAALWFLVVGMLALWATLVFLPILFGACELAAFSLEQWIMARPGLDGDLSWVRANPEVAEWWSQRSRREVLAEWGGWWRREPMSFGLMHLGVIALWGVPLGFLFGNILLHVRRVILIALSPGLLVAPVIAVAIAAGEAALPSGATSLSAWQVADHVVSLHVPQTLLPTAWLGLVIGVLVSRPMLRGLVRLLLPPRGRLPLAFLWTQVGLEPPTRDPRFDAGGGGAAS